MLIELAKEIGLYPKRTSSTNGGEFHSPCPHCGGSDRFILWPQIERYWCRRCNKKGDVIQFCRDFLDMNLKEAQFRTNNEDRLLTPKRDVPPTTLVSSKSWHSKAQQFIEACHHRLLIDPAALQRLQARGLSMETIRKYYPGWNPLTVFPRREEWGLEKKIENGKEKKLWVPSGIILPIFQEGSLCKIKIRRADWVKGDRFGKYYILPGSKDYMTIVGDSSNATVVLVEAEFDAMLIVQESESLCCCVALGGAQKRPDASLDHWLRTKSVIFFALDYDAAGREQFPFWRSSYSNLHAWPVPKGKSPEEAWQRGVNLKTWILDGFIHIRSQ